MDINALKAKSLKHAEIRKAHNKKYQESKDKTEMECGCGAKFKAYNKYQHNISKKHIEWLESQQPAEQPVEKFTNYTVGETNELKRAEDKIIELALALNSRDNKLNRLYSIINETTSVDNMTMKQMTDLCLLVLKYKQDNTLLTV